MLFSGIFAFFTIYHSNFSTFLSQRSLTGLMAKILGAEPQFVRCIKPNCQSRNDFYEDREVQRQLQYTGVLETIKIRRMGFPCRLPFADVIRR